MSRHSEGSARRIPRPAGESAGLRDDARVGMGWIRRRQCAQEIPRPAGESAGLRADARGNTHGAGLPRVSLRRRSLAPLVRARGFGMTPGWGWGGSGEGSARRIPRPAGESAGLRDDARSNTDGAVLPRVSLPQEIPRPAGESAGLRDDARSNTDGSGTSPVSLPQEIPRPAGESAGLRDDARGNTQVGPPTNQLV
jgi:hypothetical protein